MARHKRNPDRVVVRVDAENMDELRKRELVWDIADGRTFGISRAINKSLKDYLGRI